MAKSYAHCATPDCANTIYFIENNRKSADRKAAWAEEQGFICSECQDKLRQAENTKAAEQNQAAGLPKLNGSDKQIAWAEKIRAGKLETVRQARAGELDRLYFEAYWGTVGFNNQAMPVDDVNIDYAIGLLMAQTAASWWIDHREAKVGFILSALFIAHPPIPSEPEHQAVIDDAAAEATVRPQDPVTETIAEISIGEQSVSVSFPEKREAFRLLIKKYGFLWSNNRWKRNLNDTSGTPFDRAAEIGHILLANNYIVRLFDARCRAAMINGQFETEQTRWISLYTTGKESGRLCIRWDRRDEDYWKVAKRLPTARYAKPHLSVAVEQFEQVLDFAEINGFSITEAARVAIDQARHIKQAALVVSIEHQEPEKRGDDGKPIELVTPENVEVDDDLRD